MSTQKKYIISGLVSMFVALGFAYWQIPDNEFRIYFLDIGQGDSVLIKTPENQQILIDGGPQNKVIEELAEVMPFFDKSLDLVVLTHPHADHIDGLVEVLKRYEVKNVLFTGVQDDGSVYKEFLKEIGEQEINLYIAEKNTDFRFGAVVLDVIYPSKQVLGENFNNLNNSSIAMKIFYKGKTILLTGDLEMEAEEKLIRSGTNLKADIFKAGHHGSRTSSTWNLLKKVDPNIVVIQSGKNNKFGHPHAETLENLEKLGIEKVYRNDLNGRVEISF